MMNFYRALCIGFAITAALAACSPAPTATPRPAPSPTQTVVPATATIAPPTATTTLTPTVTRAPATVTPTATIAHTSNEPPPVAITLVLAPEPSFATATFTMRGSRTQVDLNFRSSATDLTSAAAIYEWSCEKPGILRYPLANVVNGKSTTTVDVSFNILWSGILNLTVKKSANPADASLACVAIPEAYFIQLDQGPQPGVAVAFAQAGGTEVDAFIKPGPPGAAQPALIRIGACGNLGGIRYSLEPIVDGVSKTFFGVAFSQFKKERGALNVHKSVQELDVTTVCDNLVPPD